MEESPTGPYRLDPRVERTRSVVLDTTSQLLTEVGLERTSIECVAERSGVARSTIYRHWPSTAALVMDALEHAKSAVEDADSASGDDETDLRNLLDQLGEMLRSPASNLIADIGAAASRDPELARLQEDYMARRRRHATEIVSRLQVGGVLRDDVDPVDAVELVVSVLFYRRFHLQHPMTDDEVRAHADRAFVLLAAPS